MESPAALLDAETHPQETVGHPRTRPAYRHEWITEESRWRELRPQWDEMVRRSPVPSIYCTWSFLEASWVHFARPKGDRLAVIALFEGEKLAGAAPLRVRRHRILGLPVRRLIHLATREANRVPPLVGSGVEAELAGALRTALEANPRHWDWIDLDDVDPDSVVVRCLGEWASGSGRHRLELVSQPPSPYLDLSEGWDAVRQGFGRHRRSELRHQLRLLDSAGEWRVEVQEGQSTAEILASYLEVEARSWKPAAGQGITRSQATQAFYRDLLPELGREGRAVASFLWLNGQRIAAMIEFVIDGTVWGVHKAYDAEAARFAPGNCLANMCLERWAKQGMKSYELLGLFLEDKSHWTHLSRPNTRLRIRQLRSLRQRLLFSGFGQKARRPGGESPEASS
jgi:CelD/BcsL family acetyltransferase involved in cellulose biosynthesis